LLLFTLKKHATRTQETRGRTGGTTDQLPVGRCGWKKREIRQRTIAAKGAKKMWERRNGTAFLLKGCILLSQEFEKKKKIGNVNRRGSRDWIGDGNHTQAQKR